MELRVWVDGTQRVVCGVKLTTTCQEIVFALAHATQQAGRFTMIERWRNNERLLSPNEQPLVTLQRWGDHMKEVEFILRKTSTDTQHAQPTQQQQQQPQQSAAQLQKQRSLQQVPLSRSTIDNEPTQQLVNTNNIRDSPISPMTSIQNQQQQQQILNQSNRQSFDSMYQQHHSHFSHQNNQYNLTRRPQTVLGSLTGSSASLIQPPMPNPHYMPHQMNQFSRQLSSNLRAAMSSTTLPSATNSMTASPSGSTSMVRPQQYQVDDQQAITSNPLAMLPQAPLNGYQVHSEQTQQNKASIQQQQQLRSDQLTKNFPYEDLYSTINKKRTNQPPPAVPAKPRVIPQLNNLPMTHSHVQQQQTVQNAQMNYYHPNQSPMAMYQPQNVRPRHPPGYLDYLEAMANRNSLPQPVAPNSYLHHQIPQGNILQRNMELGQPMYGLQQNGSVPIDPMATATQNRYRYSINNPLSNTLFEQTRDVTGNTTKNLSKTQPKLVESSGLVVNRGSAVNIKLPSSSQNINSLNSSFSEQHSTLATLNNSPLNISDANSSVSQVGHDMLRVIEEQKKVLLSQKSELDKLDNDQEYWETRQNTEQMELVNRIENEIRQLESLWKENQAQINKLESHDFERELQELRAEQLKMESQIDKQKDKLSQFESDIVACNSKIQQLQTELSNLESISIDDDSETGDNVPTKLENSETNTNLVASRRTPSKESINSVEDLSRTSRSSDLITNGTSDHSSKETKSSDEEEDEEDSGGDASDDLNTSAAAEKLRSAVKDVNYVEKRGLISGIRSLKIDKSRALGRQQIDSLRQPDVNLTTITTMNPNLKVDESSSNLNNNNSLEKMCLESNGAQQNNDTNKTANNNKYEFLMTL